MQPEQIIQEALDEIQIQHDIEILFAVESGSRAWGFPSTDSDYDVRFVYYRPAEYYYSITRRELFLDRSNAFSVLPENSFLASLDFKLYDFSGWDLIKTFGLIAKGNQQVNEWAESPIVYRGTEFLNDSKFRSLLKQQFDPISAVYHYKSMAKADFVDWSAPMSLKKMMYFMRAILCVYYIQHTNNNPPVCMDRLVKAEAYPKWGVPSIHLLWEQLLNSKLNAVESVQRKWSEFKGWEALMCLAENIAVERPSVRDYENRVVICQQELYSMRRYCRSRYGI